MYLIFDTETVSRNFLGSVDVNIHDHYPFLVPYVVADKKLNIVYQDKFTFNEIDKENIFKDWLIKCPTIVGANIKYDIHMLLNHGYNKSLFVDKNYIDVQVLARLVIKHDLQDDSFSVALKKLAVQYLGIDSNKEEETLKRELSNLNADHKKLMATYMGIDVKDIYEDKKWYRNYDKYPEEVKKKRIEFLRKHPRPSYQDCKNVYTYGMTDALLTYGLFKLWYPKAVQLKQVPALMRTSEATFPLIEMERKGLVVNMKKLLHDRDLLRQELSKINIISPIDGSHISINQNLKLKKIYEFETGLKLPSADKKVREQILDKSPTAAIVEYGAILTKYFNSYACRILEKLSKDNGEYKIYTQYKLSGTVTGRLSSDFQQFPKEPFELKTGDVIDIRSWFCVPKEDKYMFYFDYSQLELRLQCEWINLVNGTPDRNMTRAFMPYDCIKKDGKYYLAEDPNVEWVPTDLHGLTTKNAFPGMDESNPEWSHYRKLGKRCNFACNYGAAPAKIADSLNVDMDTAIKLVNGYKNTYKGLQDFGKWIYKRSMCGIDAFPNLFKRMYYSTNKHKLQNWLVQGSGADLLLIKLKDTYEYIKTHPWWNFILSVHDEIVFTCSDIDKKQIAQEVKEIQELMKCSLTAVDIISDVEYTTTNWGSKKDYNEEEFLSGN